MNIGNASSVGSTGTCGVMKTMLGLRWAIPTWLNKVSLIPMSYSFTGHTKRGGPLRLPAASMRGVLITCYLTAVIKKGTEIWKRK